MKELLKKIIFLACFILLIPTLSPLSASAAIQFDYDYKTYDGQSALTSTKDLILTQISFNPNAAREYMYRSDIFLVTEAGIKNQITATNESYQIFSYNNQSFVAMYNQSSAQFTLYDEQLQLIDDRFLTSTDGEKNFYMNQLENYIVFTRDYYDPKTGVPQTETKFYNLQTLAFEEVHSTKIHSTTLDAYAGIVLKDKFSQIKKIIPYRNISFEGNPYNSLIYEDNIILLTRIETSRSHMYMIYVLDFEGNIVHSFTLENSDNIEYTYLASFIINEKLVLAFNSDYPEEKSRVYEYDLNTFKLTGPKQGNFTFDSNYVTNTIYQESHWYSNEKKITFKNSHGDVLSHFSYNRNLDNFYISADYVNSFYTNKNSNNTQLIVKKYEYPTQKNYATIYDYSTGKELGQFSQYKDFQFLNDPNYILALNWETRHDIDLKATLIKLTDKETPPPTPTPTGPTYPANKMWKVTTSKTIDATKVTANHVYVKDAKGQRVDVTFTVKDNELFVHAPTAGYQSKQSYTLYVEGLVSVEGDALKEPKSKMFTIR